jgi:hypothetical protein
VAVEISWAYFSMCGPKFWSMNYSSKVDEMTSRYTAWGRRITRELMERLVSIK